MAQLAVITCACPVQEGQLWRAGQGFIRVAKVDEDGGAVAEKLNLETLKVELTVAGTMMELREVLGEMEAALVV